MDSQRRIGRTATDVTNDGHHLIIDRGGYAGLEVFLFVAQLQDIAQLLHLAAVQSGGKRLHQAPRHISWEHIRRSAVGNLGLRGKQYAGIGSMHLQVFAIANRFTRHQDLTAADRSFPSLASLHHDLID